MSHAAQPERKQALGAEHPAETPAAAEVSASATEAELLAFRPRAGAAAMITQGAEGLLPHKRWWKPAGAGVVTVLVMAGWIAYTHRGPASPASTSALERSNAIEQQVPFAPPKLVPAHSTSEPQTAPVPKQEKKKAARTALQRVRVWRNQVDYIAEDVTVRYFTPKPAVALPKQPIGSATQPGARRIQPPVVAHAADKPGIEQISVQDKKCGQGHLGRRLACWLHKVFPIHKLNS